jgi:predicted nucleic acid-binding protein
VARATHLIDTSAFARLSKPLVVAVVAPLAAAGRIAVCAPVMFELGFSAQNAVDHQALMSRLDAFECLPVTDGDQRRALELQAMLAERGQHRALSLVDALVAAVAEVRGLRILHYDADFELVAALTGQAQQWVVERGTAD